MSNLPKGWELLSLNDFADITKLAGYEFTEHFDYALGGDIIALRALNVVGGKIILNDIQTISREISNKLPRSKLYMNDILFTYVGTLGQVAIIEENDKYHLAPNVAKITIKDKVIAKFLLYYLMSNLGQNQIKLLSTTTSQPAINMQNIRKIQLFLPPLEEQKKIADILSTVDKKIAFVEENINATEELKKGLMQKLLTEGIGHTEFKDSELGRIPKSWEIDILNNLSKVTDSLHMTPEFEEEGFPMVRVADIKNGKLNLSNALKVSKEMYELFTKSYIPKKKDIVLSRVGSYGVSSFVDTEEPFCMGQNTVIINPKIDSFYLYSILNSEEIKKQIENLSYGSGYKSLSLKNIRELKIKLPPLEEQKQIAEILSTVDKKLENLKEKKQSFEELKKGLMQKLLTGEVRV